eukprot:618725-Amphidinium_carterae.1
MSATESFVVPTKDYEYCVHEAIASKPVLDQFDVLCKSVCIANKLGTVAFLGFASDAEGETLLNSVEKQPRHKASGTFCWHASATIRSSPKHKDTCKCTLSMHTKAHC